jgi:beta-lactamase class A
MMELFRRAHVGDLSLDSMLSIKNSFASFADGEPFSLNEKDDAETTLYHRIGEGETLREINRLMIVRSSNLATNMLLEVLGAAQITSFMHEIGATGLEVRRGPEDDRAFTLGMNNVATARGLMHIFRLLAEGRVVSPEASAEMVEVLLGQEFIEGIPAGLPSGSRVAHKTGWINRHYHDVGIVFLSDRAPWVLAILTKGLDEATDGPRLVAAISRLVEGST